MDQSNPISVNVEAVNGQVLLQLLAPGDKTSIGMLMDPADVDQIIAALQVAKAECLQARRK